jgi:RNA polymerase sigma-70 factor (ECF subfamily)
MRSSTTREIPLGIRTALVESVVCLPARSRFDDLVKPHLDAAHNLARWLLRDPNDAQDAVQEAALRAFRFVDSLQGGAKAWLLSIVRNACFTRMSRERPSEQFDEELHGSVEIDPELLAQRAADRALIDEELEKLPPEFREALVLRELEGLSYKEIAQVAGVPIGTVMSRLSRARRLLMRALVQRGRSAP